LPLASPPFLTKSYTLAAFCQRKSCRDGVEDRFHDTIRACPPRHAERSPIDNATTWHLPREASVRP
jgi:hypothetical protein